MHKVYCIIVTYNGEKWIRKCLSTIEEPNLDLTIVVVDNNSTDKTVQIIKDEFPFVRLIEKKENLGFGGANNFGYEIAKKDGAEYIYLLNQDTISYPDAIFQLSQIAEASDKIGVVSPTHLNDNGDKLDKKFEEYITAKSCPNYISDVSLGRSQDYYEIGFVNAAAWLVKTEVIEAIGGLFSKAFFHYGEDSNFLSRLKYHGFSSVITPKIYVHHLREERKGKPSKKFVKKQLNIKMIEIMTNINRSYSESISTLYKYAAQQFFKGNILGSLKLFAYPILNFMRITAIRKSYLTKKIY